MKKINIIPFIFICLLNLVSIPILAQNKVKKNDMVKTSSYVVQLLDKNNAPISDVSIKINGKISVLSSNSLGNVKILSNKSDKISFSKIGFLEAVYTGKQLINKKSIVLEESENGILNESDVVSMPFSKRKIENLSVGCETLRLDDFSKYNSSTSIGSMLQSQLLGMSGGINVRGSEAEIIIDGMSRGSQGINYIWNLNIEEIDNVTILKDAVSKALYGQYSDSPIILITTKRGKSEANDVKVSYDFTLSKPMYYPEYMNSADYMTYYNYARANDNNNIPNPLYTELEITNTRSGIDPILYPDNNLLTNEFLKEYKTNHRLNIDFRGGRSWLKYYLNLGYNHDNSILKFNNKSERFNVRGNIDIKINSFITAYLDGNIIITKSNAPKFLSKNFWQMTSTFLPNDYPYLIPIDRISEDNANMLKVAKLIDGKYIMGGKTSYEQNPYGDINFGGYSKNNKTFSQFNFGMDVNLDGILKGLKFSTKLGYDEYNTYDVKQSNSYAVYFLNYNTNGDPILGSDDKLTITQGNNKNSFTGNQSGSGQTFYQRIGNSNYLSWNFNKNKHSFNSNLISYLEYHVLNNSLYTDKMENFGLNLNYVYDEKYMIDAVSMLQGTARLYKKWGNSNSYGLSWILSKEKFLNNIDWLSFLKVGASYGIIKTDREGLFLGALNSDGNNNYYLYENTFKSGGGFTFIEGKNKNIDGVMLNTKGNKDIDWIGRKDFNIGFNSILFNNSLSIKGNYFYSKRFNNIVKLNNKYPSFIGPSEFISYTNYGESSQRGYELGIGISKTIDNFKINANINYLTYKGKNDKVDELERSPELSHLKSQGAISDGIRGLICEGIYTQEEIDAIDKTQDNPFPKFGTPQAGDLKYKDITGDGFVDNNDKLIIGNWNPRHIYNFSLSIGYKNFNFYMQGQARSGSEANIETNNYYGYTQQLNKYPERLKEAWIYCPELGVDNRETAKYPRLSALYNGNNSQTSTFWLRSNDYFEVSTLQFTYSLPQKIICKYLLSGLDIYVRGENLLTVASEKERIKMNIGSEPNYRILKVGFKANF